MGNLLADETLWQARIAPTAASTSCREEELDACGASCARRSARRIRKGGAHTGRVLPGPDEGALPALRSRAAGAATIGGRTTYWCPVCQT